MSFRLYMDVHVPGPITRGLRRRGVDVLTAQEDGRDEADDADVLARARDLERVAVSFDEDFHEVVASFKASGHEFAGYIHIDHGTLTIGQCVKKLEIMAKTLELADIWNADLHLAQW